MKESVGDCCNMVFAEALGYDLLLLGLHILLYQIIDQAVYAAVDNIKIKDGWYRALTALTGRIQSG
jgi:hypothetical protein